MRARAPIEFGPNSHTVDVKALTEGIRSFTQAPYVFTTSARAREIFGIPEDKSTFFLVELAPQADVAPIQQEIKARLSNAKVLTKAEFRSRSISRWLCGTRVSMASHFGRYHWHGDRGETLYSASDISVADASTG